VIGLDLTERRSSAPLDSRTWAALSESGEFWTLVDRKILQVRQLRAGTVLRPQAYVGRALADGVEIRIGSKVKGALESLISFASRGSFRLEPIHVTATDPGPLTRLLIEAFLDAAGRYLQFGMDFEYRPLAENGTFVRGRLDMPRSMHLWAGGRPNQVAYVRREQSTLTPLNLLIAAGLVHAERLAQTLGEAASVRARARSYLLVFPLESLENTRSRELIPDADELKIDLPLARDAAELATAVLAAAGFEVSAVPLDRTVPRSWFLNLETLFEQALRTTLRRASAVTSVRNGKSESRHVFPGPADESLDASPDLLVAVPAGLVVGDVKYKDWTGQATASDLYQLLVHTATFEAKEAFLVFPGDRYESRDMGPSSLGIHVRLFSVRPTQLAADAETLAGDLAAWRAAPTTASA
jgi:hypothetical protein